jgi:hypothetical protein
MWLEDSKSSLFLLAALKELVAMNKTRIDSTIFPADKCEAMGFVERGWKDGRIAFSVMFKVVTGGLTPVKLLLCHHDVLSLFRNISCDGRMQVVVLNLGRGSDV